MRFDRRQTLALAAAAAAAACHKHRLTTPAPSASMDTRLLDVGFPALAHKAAPGAFALGVMDLATTKTWYWNTERAFPLAGAAALPIAAAALAQADAGKLSLNERATFSSLDLSPPPSLIGADWPSPPDNRGASMRVGDLMALALREGDTTAIDVLMKRVGGPGEVGAFLQAKGVLGLRVDRYQREIQAEMFGMPTFRAAWAKQADFDAARGQIAPTVRQAAMDRFILDPRDTATAPAALGFLALLAAGELVSPAATAALLALMSSAPGGLFRAGLPAGTRVAHTAGAPPANLGFTPATTELAVATLPSGRRYALAGFLIGSTATAGARAGLFAAGSALAARAIGYGDAEGVLS
jgi:beta-lactamase class A